MAPSTTTISKHTKSSTWPKIQTPQGQSQQSRFALHDDHAVYLSLTAETDTSGGAEKSWWQKGFEARAALLYTRAQDPAVYSPTSYTEPGPGDFAAVEMIKGAR